MIIDLSRIKYCEEWKEGVYAHRRPPPYVCLKLVCKKGGAYFGEFMVNAVVDDNYYVYACHYLCKFIDRSFLLASFPGPAQLSVAFSTASDGKLGGA